MSGGVAVPVKKCGDVFLAKPIINQSDPHEHYGTVFTYLPLPIKSGLPVHINGAFAVSSSRRHLCERNEDDKFDMRAIWNEALMEDSVCTAYINMLQDIAKITLPSESAFHNLWPSLEYTETNCKVLLKSLYKAIANGGSPTLLADGNNWISLANSRVLEKEMHDSEVKDIVLQVCRDFTSEDSAPVVDLPEFAWAALRFAEMLPVVQERSLSMHSFYKDIFFPNIDKIESVRDLLVLHALDSDNEDIVNLVKQTSCIPVSPNGEYLKKPSELIHPNSDLAPMFLSQDSRFPHGKHFNKPEILQSLSKLGMKDDILTWEETLERFQSTTKVEPHVALGRVTSLVNFLSKLGDVNSGKLPPTIMALQGQIVDIPFIPTMKRPQNFPLDWKEEHLEEGTLISPGEAFPPSMLYLVGSTDPIINQVFYSKCSSGVKELLGIENSTPKLDNVLHQLLLLMEKFNNLEIKERNVWDNIENIAHAVYSHLQKVSSADQAALYRVRDALDSQPFVVAYRKLLPPKLVTFNFSNQCSPYLYRLPDDLQNKFGTLFRALGVRENFEPVDYIHALQEMYGVHNGFPLEKDQLKIALALANLLSDCLSESDVTLNSLMEEYGTIYVPDSDCILQGATELCFNEPSCAWLPRASGTKFSHPNLPFMISKQLGVNTQREDVLKKHSRGMAFGQREKLTNRIQRILSGYPCDKEIFKELLQNSDDAGSTEIHFIKDPRQHGVERIFDETWKPLQGAALCVYNNKAFTQNDIEGIQRLGEGSKSLDPSKTGQYGVGFNCVYHLTDAPSFITCGPDVGQILCVFDPHAKYVPGSTTAEPGRRYDDIMTLRNIFSDIFPTYLEDKFNLKDATMFRLPLRTEEMAKESELSDEAMSLDKVDTLLTKFKSEMFDCLLFVNHMQKICISEIDKLTNRLTNSYVVTANVAPEDVEKRTWFSEKVKEISRKLKDKTLSLDQVKPECIVYPVKISDNRGRWEKWLVSQQIGLANGTEVKDSIRDAMKRGDLKLLPRGGVAALIDSSDSQTKNKNRRIFCFLPLPLQVEIPVHINGHFALDHESRRNLWRDEDTGYKTDWNNTLIESVIAPAYVALLQRIPKVLIPTMVDGEDPDTNFIEKEHETQLELFKSLFPTQYHVEPYWQLLIDGVYRCIHETGAKVLPVVQPCLSDVPRTQLSAEVTHTSIEWLSTKGSVKHQPYFDDLDATFKSEEDEMFRFVTGRGHASTGRVTIEKSEIVRNVLIQSGMKLLSLPLAVCERFRQSGVKVNVINPETVIEFYRGNSDFISLLPTAVENTPVANSRRLQILMQYLQTRPVEFLAHLEGLPLLLTGDNMLRVFTKQSQVFLSPYLSLLPDCGSVFVHEALLDGCFNQILPGQNSVFKDLNIEGLAQMLPTTISVDDYCGKESVAWNSKSEGIPNARWVAQLFTFLREEMEKEGIELETSYGIKSAGSKLKPLDDWCLVPAFTPVEQQNISPNPYRLSSGLDVDEYLVQFKMVQTIIDFSQASVTSYTLRDSLRHLKPLELHSRITEVGTPVGGQKTVMMNSDFAKYLVSSVDRPKSVLTVLKHMVDSEKFLGALAPPDCNVILKYFNDCLSQWKDCEKSMLVLRDLPIYMTVHGSLTSLGSRSAYVLPSDIPKIDMDQWENRAGIIFLRANPFIKDMYDAMNCTLLSVVELYKDFIFKNFGYMSEEARLKHLEYLKETKLFHMRDSERELMISSLENLEFLRDGEGVLRKASHFYDPTHKVFRAMFGGDPNMCPPRPYSDYKWLDFLRQIGLQHEVTPEMIIDFATGIAMEAEMNPSENTLNQARALVDHIFRRPNVVKENILQEIADIPFIPSVKVNQIMNRLVPQHGLNENGTTAYIKISNSVSEKHEYLAWSSSPLLPNWANPLELTRDDVKIQLPPNDPLADFPSYKEDMAVTLGIQEYPSTETVVNHCLNLCNVQTSVDVDELNAFMKLDVMRAIYKYLQHQALDFPELLTELKDAPCIMLEQGRCFVTPAVVSINLMEEDQIPPYMYRLPIELGEFQPLFMKLGVTQSPTSLQFANILENLSKCTGNYRMHPNELVVAFKCVRGFLKTLKKHPEQGDEIRDLYLPSRTGHLVHSSKLIYVDDMNYMDRIENFNKPLLIDLVECDIVDGSHDGSEYWKLLPESLKPQMLTLVVKEQLQEACRYTAVNSSVADKYRNQIYSKPFHHGIQRLMKQENRKHRQNIDADTIEAVPRILRSSKVVALNRLVTYLSVDCNQIENSELETDCYIEFQEQEESQWVIYICNSSTVDDELTVGVGEAINKIFGGLLKHSVQYIQAMLSCAPHAISRVLDKLKIRPDMTSDQSASVLPPPGAYVPIEDHHLLSEEFSNFETGEYVGYEIDDPGLQNEEGSATYIYAIIVEKADLQNRRESILTNEYIINIGDNHPPISVPATDLYKFHRVDGFAPKQNEFIHDRTLSCDDLLSPAADEIGSSSGYGTDGHKRQSASPDGDKRKRSSVSPGKKHTEGSADSAHSRPSSRQSIPEHPAETNRHSSSRLSEPRQSETEHPAETRRRTSSRHSESRQSEPDEVFVQVKICALFTAF